jgi:hypothetical protein
MLNTLTLKQLNDPDPLVRRQAVIALGKSQQQDALPYLATVFKKDTDLEIRQLARKAGVYIKQQSADTVAARPVVDNPDVSTMTTSNEDDDLMSSGVTYYEELELPDPETVVEVSEANQKRAKGLLDQVMDMHLRGDNGKAIHYFQQALKRNPNLKTDPYARSLASTITRISNGEQAIRVIQADMEQKRGNLVGNQPPAEPGETWRNALIDLVIYGLVTGLTICVSMFIVFSVLIASDPQDMAQRIENVQQGIRTDDDFVSAVTKFLPNDVMAYLLTDYSPAMAITFGTIFGVVSTVWLFIYYVFVHLVSVRFYGGKGTFVRLITQATIRQSFLLPGLIIGAFLLNFIMISDPKTSRWEVSFFLLSIVVYFSVFSRSIGEAYRFGGRIGGQALAVGTFAFNICTTVVVLGIVYVGFYVIG